MKRIRLWLAFRCWAISNFFLSLGYVFSMGKTYEAYVRSQREK